MIQLYFDKNVLGCGFESHRTNVLVKFFHTTRVSAEYTVLDIGVHGVWVKTKLVQKCFDAIQ